jgi:hypothetical protein
MRPWLSLLLLACAAAVRAEDAPPNPLLVLDAAGHTATVHNVLFTPDGKELITVAGDRTIRFWDVVWVARRRAPHGLAGQQRLR